MATITKGSISLNFGLVRVTGDLSDDDRQCAWELYTELHTRVALVGKSSDPDCTEFEGELLIESLESVYKFFTEARGIMRKFPVGRLAINNSDNLGVLISKILSHVLRPFLEKWQVKYRHWWEHSSNPRLPPMERQKEFPDYDDFISDWSNVRYVLRGVQKEIVSVYKLIDIDGVV
ncbi:hypothetical protein ACQZV8_18315 [Magnetococcales bacterium HHB-1]